MTPRQKLQRAQVAWCDAWREWEAQPSCNVPREQQFFGADITDTHLAPVVLTKSDDRERWYLPKGMPPVTIYAWTKAHVLCGKEGSWVWQTRITTWKKLVGP